MKFLNKKLKKNKYIKFLGALGIILLKTSNCSVAAMENEDSADKTPWTSMLSPTEAYKEYLTYAGEEVKAGILYNQEVSQQERSLDYVQIVQAHASQFKPIKPYLGSGGYCDKLTIRNLNGYISIIFDNRVPLGTLDMEMVEEEPQEPKKGMNEDKAQQIQFAFRNIVPSQFKRAPQLAGPMAFHESIIDAENQKEFIVFHFFTNPESPIKFDIQNCSGHWFVVGDKSVKNKFKYDEYLGIKFIDYLHQKHKWEL